jgi:hypothetical protein
LAFPDASYSTAKNLLQAPSLFNECWRLNPGLLLEVRLAAARAVVSGRLGAPELPGWRIMI